MNLALFDFDGTITNKDTFTAFIYFAVSKQKIFWGKVLLSPKILCYKMGLLSAAKAREAVAGFAFKGCQLSQLYLSGNQFAQNIIPKHLRPEVIEQIQWHKDQGDKIVVVSADEDKIIKRLVEKKISAKEFKKRVKEQIPLIKKEKNSDFVIQNNGTVKDLKNKVDYLIKDISGICIEKR